MKTDGCWPCIILHVFLLQQDAFDGVNDAVAGHYVAGNDVDPVHQNDCIKYGLMLIIEGQVDGIFYLYLYPILAL